MISGVVVRIATNKPRLILLRHSQCRIWVSFHESLPEGVAYGSRISLIGKLRSYNIGRLFHVVSAACLSVTPQAFMKVALKDQPDAVIKHWEKEMESK